MAGNHAKVSLAKSGTTTIAELTGWTYDCDASLQDNELLAATVTYTAGKLVGSGTLSFNLMYGDTGGQDTIRTGDTVTLAIYPSGVGVGKKFSGSVIIDSYGVEVNKNGINEGTASFKGVLTEAAA